MRNAWIMAAVGALVVTGVSCDEVLFKSGDRLIGTVKAVALADITKINPEKVRWVGAVGLISTAIAGVVGAIAGLPLSLGLVAIFLLISGPSMIRTWFKLRARDMAPILNACGWAVTRRVRLSLKLGRRFTSEAALWFAGLLDSMLPGCMKKNAATPAFNVTVEAPALPASK